MSNTQTLAELYVQDNGLAVCAGDDTQWALALGAANFARLRRPYWDDARDRQTRFCNCTATTTEFYFRNPGTGAHGLMCGKCKGITQTG